MNNKLVNIVGIGNTLVYYNRWKNFESREIAECFMRLTPEEKELLNEGDLIWSDREPYNPHGKVYGFTLLEIYEITRSKQETTVHVENGYFTFEYSNGFFKVIPGYENKLIWLIEEFSPGCFDTGGNRFITYI